MTLWPALVRLNSILEVDGFFLQLSSVVSLPTFYFLPHASSRSLPLLFDSTFGVGDPFPVLLSLYSLTTENKIWQVSLKQKRINILFSLSELLDTYCDLTEIKIFPFCCSDPLLHLFSLVACNDHPDILLRRRHFVSDRLGVFQFVSWWYERSFRSGSTCGCS